MSRCLCPDQEGHDLSVQPVASPTTTYYAPAGRDAPAEFHHKAKMIERVPLLAKALDAMPGMVAILNSNRQIVAANRRFLDILGVTMAQLVEKRPGEAIKCLRANDGPDGCGTSMHCSTCGAVNALLDCREQNAEAVRECRVLVRAASEVVPLDLRVTASPFQIENEFFVLAAIEDISHEKRVAVLQRTFFHDVLNTAGCIRGYADCLAEDSTSDPEMCQRLNALSGQLIEEIQSQRDLLHAESGDLKTQPVSIEAGQVLEELRSQYLKHPLAISRKISIGQVSARPIVTDRRLLLRVLGNMLKNALEATSPNGTVTIACREDDETVTFLVINPEVMPHEIQLQIFQRSFSTKGESGRGIGTYSMKLFGERYLGGTVDFVSRSPEGTTFRLQLPGGRTD